MLGIRILPELFDVGFGFCLANFERQSNKFGLIKSQIETGCDLEGTSCT